jgi:hypothetical protein
MKILRVAPIPALSKPKAEDYLRCFGPYAQIFHLSREATVERICRKVEALGGVDIVVLDCVHEGSIDAAEVADRTGASVLKPVYGNQRLDSRNLTIFTFSHYEEVAA